MSRKAAQNSGAQRKMPKGRRFPKGKSANPGGRPKVPRKVREWLEANADEWTIEMLEALRFWTGRRGKSDGNNSIAASLGGLKKTMPDGAVKIQLELSGPEGGPVETKVVELNDSPGSLARVVNALRSAGLLAAGHAGEGVDTEADPLDSSKPD